MAYIHGFQSTPPVRGATFAEFAADTGLVISIHAPRAGGDHQRQARPDSNDISIHAPRAGGDTSSWTTTATK